MTTATPAELVKKIEHLYKCEREKDLDGWAALWAEDSLVTFPIDVNPGERDVRGKDSIVAWTGQKFIDREWTDIDARLEGMAEGGRVLAHLNVMLHFADGTAIGGSVLCIFTFDDSGRISLMEEYVNEATWPKNYKDFATPDTAKA